MCATEAAVMPTAKPTEAPMVSTAVAATVMSTAVAAPMMSTAKTTAVSATMSSAPVLVCEHHRRAGQCHSDGE
jgi:hypothetical protein